MRPMAPSSGSPSPPRKAPRSILLTSLCTRSSLAVLLVVFVLSITIQRTFRLVGRWRTGGPRSRNASGNKFWSFWSSSSSSDDVQPHPGSGSLAQRRANFEAGLRWENAAGSQASSNNAVNEDDGKLCVVMPALTDLRIALIALPKEAYTVSGAMSRAGLDDGTMTEITNRKMSQTEEFVENLKALWSFTEGLTLRSGDIDLSTVRLRNMGWTAVKDSLLDGAKYISHQKPAGILSTPILKRALAATPVLFEHLQRSLDRYVYTSYKWPTETEQMVVSAFMTSPYVSIVDGRNMSKADFKAYDYVVIPFPLTNMRMRPSVLIKLKRILKQHAPALEEAPHKHVFIWGRIVQDAVKTLDYFETMRTWVKRYPIRQANLLTYEPYRISDGITRQHAIPYPGIVRYDELSYLPPSEQAGLSYASPFDVVTADNVDTDALAEAYASVKAETKTVTAVADAPSSQSDAAPLPDGDAAAAAVVDSFSIPLPPSSGSKAGIAAPVFSPPRWECDPVHAINAWKRARRKEGRSVSSSNFSFSGGGVTGDEVLLGMPLSSPKPWPVRVPFVPGGADGGSGEKVAPTGPGRGAATNGNDNRRNDNNAAAECSEEDAMATIRALRPILASFIGSAIGESADRTAVLKQLYHCADCAIFDAGHFASNTQHNHFGIIWSTRLSVFCVQPTSKTQRKGESPSRKGFFDALLLGCIPVVVDRKDPSAGATAPLLPYAWAIPWREIAVMLPRSVMTGASGGGVVAALRAISAGEIRLRQSKLAEAARLVQWNWRIMEFKTLVRKAFGRLGESNSTAARAALAQPGCARDAADMLMASLHLRTGKTGKEPGVHVPRKDATQLAFGEPV